MIKIAKLLSWIIIIGGVLLVFPSEINAQCMVGVANSQWLSPSTPGFAFDANTSGWQTSGDPKVEINVPGWQSWCPGGYKCPTNPASIGLIPHQSWHDRTSRDVANRSVYFSDMMVYKIASYDSDSTDITDPKGTIWLKLNGVTVYTWDPIPLHDDQAGNEVTDILELSTPVLADELYYRPAQRGSLDSGGYSVCAAPAASPTPTPAYEVPICENLRITSGLVPGYTNRLYVNEPSVWSSEITTKYHSSITEFYFYLGNLKYSFSPGVQNWPTGANNVTMMRNWTPTSTGTYQIGCLNLTNDPSFWGYGCMSYSPVLWSNMTMPCGGTPSSITVDVVARPPTLTPTPTPTPTPTFPPEKVWNLNYEFECPNPNEILYVSSFVSVKAYAQGDINQDVESVFSLNQCGLNNQVIGRYDADRFILKLEPASGGSLFKSPMVYSLNADGTRGVLITPKTNSPPLLGAFDWTENSMPPGNYLVIFQPISAINPVCGPAVITEPVVMCSSSTGDSLDTIEAIYGSLDEARCDYYCGSISGGWLCKNYSTNLYNCSLNGFPEKFDGNYYCIECTCPGC